MALELVAAEKYKNCNLIPGFDALRHDLQSQSLRKRDRGGNDGHVLSLLLHLEDEGSASIA